MDVKLSLRMSENRMFNRIFRHKRDEITGTGDNCKMRNFIISNYIYLAKDDGMSRACSKHKR
jgi:hypothetical protein